MSNYRTTVRKGQDVIIANVSALTEEEMKAVMNYKKLGYKLIDEKPKDGMKKKGLSTKKKDVEAWLKEHATEEQIKKYHDIQNEEVKDKTKLDKDGNVKKVGYVAVLPWLKETFPEYYGNKKK